MSELDKMREDLKNNPQEIFQTGSVFSKEVDMVLHNVKMLLLEKNRKYGNSALEPIRIFSNSNAIEQLNVRIDDKLSRMHNMQNDEDEDVELDLIGYLVIRHIARMR